MKTRLGIFLIPALGIILGALFFFTLPPAPAFRLTPLDPPRESWDFNLQNQLGKQVNLRDFQGKVVVLTFLYTYCPDICPLITQRLRETHRLLRGSTERVVFLAVTVDPERDTVERLYDYSKQFDMLEKWYFLTGGVDDLALIWEHYWVGKVWKDEKGNVMHQAPIHVIDPQGTIRVVSGQDFRPAELAHDIELLLKSWTRS
jgi:protein SCO1/2